MNGDGRDPIEKLNDLRSWLANNKVESVARPARRDAGLRITSENARVQPERVTREIADFEQWVNEIQSPARPVAESQRQFWA